MALVPAHIRNIIYLMPNFPFSTNQWNRWTLRSDSSEKSYQRYQKLGSILYSIRSIIFPILPGIFTKHTLRNLRISLITSLFFLLLIPRYPNAPVSHSAYHLNVLFNLDKSYLSSPFAFITRKSLQQASAQKQVLII